MISPRSSSRGLLAALAGALLFTAAPGGTALANDDVVLIQFLDSTGADANGTARARWRDKGDALDFNVELDHLDAGSYELLVGGLVRGSIAVANGEGEIEFETPKDGNKPLLDFDVFGQPIVVRQGGTVFFDDVFDPNGTGGSSGGSGGGGTAKLEVFMVNVGPDTNAKGRLRHEDRGDELRFDVEIQYLDGGLYELVVGGVPRATFDPSGFFEVELEFRNPPDDSPPDEPGEQHFLLDFDPLGQQVDVVKDGVVYLTGMLPGVAGSGAPKKAGQLAKDLGKKKGDKLAVMLLDLGVLPGAKGEVVLSQSGQTELEVEIEHVPDASYGLYVGGVLRGALVVTAGEGRLRFSDPPQVGVAPLDFDLKGQLVQVKSGEDAILAVVFPMSVPEALGVGKKETRTGALLRLNLQNAGTDLDARGSARWKASKAGRERLALEVVDLAAGDYRVLVDGVERGALTVKKDDGNGRLLFDSVAKGKKKVPLAFDVLGHLVEIVDGDGTAVLHVELQ